VGGGAWPFLVGGAICLVNSDNERDSVLLNRRVFRRLPVWCAVLPCAGRQSPTERYPRKRSAVVSGVGVVAVVCFGRLLRQSPALPDSFAANGLSPADKA
jgi:hypothetical protein